MTAGYSGKPLAQKLGVEPGTQVVAIDPPARYPELLAPLPEGAEITGEVDGRSAFVHLFATERAALAAHLERLVPAALEPLGILWISWPKKSSGEATDLDGNVVRAAGLEAGLVDVKVCAVDEIWSGLKFVFRLRDR